MICFVKYISHVETYIWSAKTAPYIEIVSKLTLHEKYSYSQFFGSECGKILTRKTPNTDTFYAVLEYHIYCILLAELQEFSTSWITFSSIQM